MFHPPHKLSLLLLITSSQKEFCWSGFWSNKIRTRLSENRSAGLKVEMDIHTQHGGITSLLRLLRKALT